MIKETFPLLEKLYLGHRIWACFFVVKQTVLEPRGLESTQVVQIILWRNETRAKI